MHSKGRIPLFRETSFLTVHRTVHTLNYVGQWCKYPSFCFIVSLVWVVLRQYFDLAPWQLTSALFSFLCLVNLVAKYTVRQTFKLKSDCVNEKKYGFTWCCSQTLPASKHSGLASVIQQLFLRRLEWSQNNNNHVPKRWCYSAAFSARWIRICYNYALSE